jgi:hypothetical protein
MRFVVLLIGFVLVTSGVAFSQQPPSPVQPTANEHEGRNNNQKHAGEYNTEARSRPGAFDFFTAKGLEKISAYCAAKPEAEPDKWLHEKFICDVHLTDIAVSVFTGLLVFVTIPLTLIGIWQGWISSSTARRQLRAYLSFSPTFIENYGTNKAVTINYQIRNHGQTPGFDIRYKFTMEVLPDPLPDGFDFPSPQRALDSDFDSLPRYSGIGMVQQ